MSFAGRFWHDFGKLGSHVGEERENGFPACEKAAFATFTSG